MILREMAKSADRQNFRGENQGQFLINQKGKCQRMRRNITHSIILKVAI